MCRRRSRATSPCLTPRPHAQVVKRVFLINTPAIFTPVWSVVKVCSHARTRTTAACAPSTRPRHTHSPTTRARAQVFMDEGTVDKMRLLGGRSHYLPQLTSFIAPEVLPAYLGGELVDAHGDPECKA